MKKRWFLLFFGAIILQPFFVYGVPPQVKTAIHVIQELWKTGSCTAGIGILMHLGYHGFQEENDSWSTTTHSSMYYVFLSTVGLGLGMQVYANLKKYMPEW